jgi:hypothetical protein
VLENEKDNPKNPVLRFVSPPGRRNRRKQTQKPFCCESARTHGTIAMKLFVTGGPGFIGLNFIRHVLGLGKAYSVVNYDKLTSAGNLGNLDLVAGRSLRQSRECIS